MSRPVCDNCINSGMCESSCSALEELMRFKREQHTKETRKILQELRELLNTTDAEPAEDLEELADSVIDEHPNELGFIKDMEIQIGYVRSYQRKIKYGQIIYADTEKTKNKYLAYLPFDFVITFYEPNTALFNDDQIRILMWHELRHIGIGEKGFKVMPHEVEDFYSIIEKHGVNWSGFNVDDVLF